MEKVRLNVLIVDDSALVTKIIGAALAQLGHRVAGTASTGVAALSSYKICNPDVVLMDFTMPDMDGITATEKITKAYPDARIIMITSHPEDRVLAQALKAGAKGFIRKPFSVEKLRASLDEIVKADLLN